MIHFELAEITAVFGSESQIATAAAKYFEYHPTHSFGVEPNSKDYWSMDVEGSIWTPPAALSPRCESELFFTHGRFYEICWNDGEVEAVFKDGQLIFCGIDETWESPGNMLLSSLEEDSILDVFGDVEAAYRLGLNPLPRLRELLGGTETQVRFDGTCPRRQRGLQAPEDKALLTVVLDDEGAIWWAVVPPGEFVTNRQRCSRHWLHGPKDFGHPRPPRRPVEEGPQPAPGPRRVAPASPPE